MTLYGGYESSCLSYTDTEDYDTDTYTYETDSTSSTCDDTDIYVEGQPGRPGTIPQNFISTKALPRLRMPGPLAPPVSKYLLSPRQRMAGDYSGMLEQMLDIEKGNLGDVYLCILSSIGLNKNKFLYSRRIFSNNCFPSLEC